MSTNWFPGGGFRQALDAVGQHGGFPAGGDLDGVLGHEAVQDALDRGREEGHYLPNS